MKRHNGWLKTAARAHTALTQHRLHATQQARSHANEAEQNVAAVAEQMHELAGGWSARRQRGEVDPSLDAAYVAFHHHLAAESARCNEAASDAKAALVQATADLQAAHGTTQVLDELLNRRRRDQSVEDMKKELQGLGESWLLGKHQTRDGIE